MGNPAENRWFTPQEEAPKKAKPNTRLVPPEGLRRPGLPPKPLDNVIAMPVPENTPMGAKAVEVHLKRPQERVDIGEVIKQSEAEAGARWEAQRAQEEAYQDQLSHAIKQFEPDVGQTEGLDISRKLKPDSMPPQPKRTSVEKPGMDQAA